MTTRISIPRKENKNIEFKEKLNSDTHLKEEKKQHLAAQMKYRLEIGNGTAIYIIGVNDSGKVIGLSEIEFEETLNILKIIAIENNASIVKVEKFTENDSLIGRIIITRKIGIGDKNHIIIGVAGHVHHGKSTLIASLMTGKADKNGTHWLYLNVLPHEIERRLSADLHFALFGFKYGKPLHFKNPLDKKERSKIVETADKIVSFVDTVGHEKWTYSTIRGLVGQNIDYGLLVVAADDGVTHITKEHMGILLAMNLPMIICITKIDKIGSKRIEEAERQIEEQLKRVGRLPYMIKEEKDIAVVLDKLDTVVPVIKTSAVTLEGYDLLNRLLLLLPERHKDLDKPFMLFIDRIYNITGVGVVVSGTIKEGRLKAGSELLLGPNESGVFKTVRAPTIEMHYYPLKEAKAGLIVGIAVKGAKVGEIKRGMILCDKSVQPKAVKTFDAEILVLNHPTRIAKGYEPVIHLQTVAEVAKIDSIDKDYLKSGDTGKVRFSFKYTRQFLENGDRFVFREGKTKGIGTVTKILN